MHSVRLPLSNMPLDLRGRTKGARNAKYAQARSVQKRGNDDLLHAWTPRACGMHLHARTRVSDAFQAVNRTVGKLCIQGTHAAIDSGTKLSDIVAALHGHTAKLAVYGFDPWTARPVRALVDCDRTGTTINCAAYIIYSPPASSCVHVAAI